MLRLLIFLVGMLATNRPRGTASARPEESYGRAAPPGWPPDGPDGGDTWYLPPQPQPPRRPFREPGTVRAGPRRRRIPRKVKWAAVLVVVGLIFRKAIAWAVLAALSATLHLVGRQRPPAACQARLAVAVGQRRDHHRYRHRPLGAAEDRGNLPARPRHRELQLHLHAQGVEEHRHLALLVFEHLRHRRPRLGHGGPQPGAVLVDARRRATTGCRSSAARRPARPAGSASPSSCPSRSCRSPCTMSRSTTRCRVRSTCSTAGPIPGSGAAP